MSKSHHEISHLSCHIYHLLCVLGLVCFFTSCHWREAKEVIATADSLDQTKHVIYDDTAALSKAIRCLDNPFGRVLMSNTLGKAYYYMGRNLSMSNQIAEAAECYIEADRLQIDNPIYRGRVNSCMGYICAQNNNDSLALIFYERASEDFKESGNEWRYAQSLLDRIEFNVKLLNYVVADSLLQIAQSYQLDSSYQARYYETKGLYFYEQQQHDSALVYFQKGLDYWQSEQDKCFSWLKMMQAYYVRDEELDSAVYYAQKIVSISENPNYVSNAYYCLMQDAKEKDDIQRLSQYAHARTDVLKLLRENSNKYVETTPKLMEYLQNPHSWRWVWITLSLIVVICIILALGAVVYRQRNRIACEQIQQLSTHVENQEARLTQELVYRQFHEKLSEIVNKYHTPHKRWRQYSMLKRDINPWLHTWFQKLDTLPLSEQEKIFCTISLIYSHLTDVEIAEYMCYAKESIRIIKHRLLKKIGISNAEFSNFLHNLSIDG